MTASGKPRAPRAFKVDNERQAAAAPAVEPAPAPARQPRSVKPGAALEFESDDFFEQETLGELESEALVPAPPARKWPGAGAIAAAALGAILSLAFWLWADALVRDLLARNAILGQVTLGVFAVFVLAVLVLVARELLALRRLRSVTALQARIASARAANNGRDIGEAAMALERYLSGHPRPHRAVHGLPKPGPWSLTRLTALISSNASCWAVSTVKHAPW